MVNLSAIQQERHKYGYKKPEARSWDRVHFTIPAQYLLKRPYRDCIEETLGIDRHSLLKLGQDDEALHIICRPSQFARFVVLRHVKYDEPNNMACLNMRLVTPVTQDDPPWDVSGNINTCGPSHSKDVS